MHQLKRIITRPSLLGVAVAGALLASALLAAGQQAEDHRHLTIGATFAKSDLAALRQQADAIALVEVVGPASAAWNSTDGRAWGEAGVTSFVYSDTPVRVVRQLRGSVPQDFDLRLVGGNADGFDMIFEASGEPLAVGERYLAFLTRQEFPTEDGKETAWTSVRLGQGLFQRDGAGWRETIQGLSIQDGEVDALADPTGGG